MTSKLYYSPFIPAFSGNGLPVAGAKLYFFYTGTNNLAPIYQDSSLSVPADNPVVSDQSARFDNIYLDADIIYRVRITNSKDVPLGDDVDPYIPGEALRGEPGPAGNVANNLTVIKTSPTSNDTMIYDGALFIWTTGNYTGLNDDVYVIKSDDHPLTEGAWVRQNANKIAVKQSDTGAVYTTIGSLLQTGWVLSSEFSSLAQAIATKRNVLINRNETVTAPILADTDYQIVECMPNCVVSPNYVGDVFRIKSQATVWRVVIDSSLQPTTGGTPGAAFVVGYSGWNSQNTKIHQSRVSGVFTRYWRGDGILWENGPLLNTTDFQAIYLTGKGIYATTNYDDNNHGFFCNSHIIYAQGGGYYIDSLSDPNSAFNSRSNVFMNSKAFGCYQNYFIGSTGNVGLLFTELGDNPDAFGPYSNGNDIGVIETRTAFALWVDNGSNNSLSGYSNFGQWEQQGIFNKLQINGRHQGYLKFTQPADLSFLDSVIGAGAGTTVLVTHDKGDADLRKDIFSGTVQFAGATPLKASTTVTGSVSVTPGSMTAGPSGAYQNAIAAGTTGASTGDNAIVTLSGLGSYSGWDFSYYIHAGGDIVYRLTNNTGGTATPGTITIRWTIIRQGS